MTAPRSAVVLAPHASHPPMDGASARSWSIARELSRQVPEVYYLARERFYRIAAGGETELLRELRNPRGKTVSALRTLLRRSHYLQEKHLPSAWSAAARRLVEEAHPDAIYTNFLWAVPSVTGAGARLFVDTHNYDPEWWTNLSRSSSNPVSRAVCRHSLATSLAQLQLLPATATLVHVSRADSERYLTHRPDLRHLVLPNGCDVRPRHRAPDYALARKQLYFLGALNLRITGDALACFAGRFWPELRESCEMHVIGSGEAGGVAQLCDREGWRLSRDVPEAELDRLLEQKHYLVLPFSYSAGSKLKLVHACGRGVPVLSTAHGVSGFNDLPPTVLVSDDAAAWAAQIADPSGFSLQALAACQKFARRFSWEHLVSEAELFTA